VDAGGVVTNAARRAFLQPNQSCRTVNEPSSERWGFIGLRMQESLTIHEISNGCENGEEECSFVIIINF
jgi:hypothetical protein